jgi:hypothetical protein
MTQTAVNLVRRHRLLSVSAVVHAFVITAALFLMYARGHMSEVEQRLWSGSATLWLLWPVVLILHPARAAVRVAAPLCVSLLLLVPAYGEYRYSAPKSFGLPVGVDLSPQAIRNYFTARAAGRADAENDLRSGRLAFEIFGLPPTEAYQEIWQRYSVDLQQTAGCTDVTPTVLGHAQGCNEVAKPEIKRRFRNDIFDTVEEESRRHKEHGEGI